MFEGPLISSMPIAAIAPHAWTCTGAARSFWNPRSSKWVRIPSGFDEAPFLRSPPATLSPGQKTPFEDSGNRFTARGPWKLVEMLVALGRTVNRPGF